jgi:hypothetical protein
VTACSSSGDGDESDAADDVLTGEDAGSHDAEAGNRADVFTGGDAYGVADVGSHDAEAGDLADVFTAGDAYGVAETGAD